MASNVVLAELSWTAAEQTQAIDRVHRIGQDQPVTAWRILAAQTVDTGSRRSSTPRRAWRREPWMEPTRRWRPGRRPAGDPGLAADQRVRRGPLLVDRGLWFSRLWEPGAVADSVRRVTGLQVAFDDGSSYELLMALAAVADPHGVRFLLRPRTRRPSARARQGCTADGRASEAHERGCELRQVWLDQPGSLVAAGHPPNPCQPASAAGGSRPEDLHLLAAGGRRRSCSR